MFALGFFCTNRYGSKSENEIEVAANRILNLEVIHAVDRPKKKQKVRKLVSLRTRYMTYQSS